MKVREKYSFLIYLFIILSLVFSIKMPTFAQEQHSSTKVRVGYFQFNGYHEMDSNCIKSGYGYDFLQLIGGYANFNYEYVGYEKSWDEMLEMLKNNEIDMLTFARYTDERAQYFDYSSQPMGYTAVILTTTIDQAKIKVGDYTTYDGIRIGMLRQSTQEKQLNAYAKEHNFSYQPVYYDTLHELTNALNNKKEVDAIATNSIRTLKNERVLDRFDETPFYVIVRKGDSELLDKVNYAMNMLDSYDPTWKITLSERYYSVSQGSLSLNSDERNYLTTLKENGGLLRILINPDLKPYSYYVNGEAQGILVDYFNSICDLYGITPDYVSVSTAKDYYNSVINHSADIVIAPNSGFYEVVQYNYNQTRSFLNAPLCILTRSATSSIAASDKIAVPNGMTSISNAALSNFQKDQIAYYDTMDGCVKAVEKGEVAGTLLYTYCAQTYLTNDWDKQLSMLEVSNTSIDFSIAVYQDTDPNLYILLNKGINSIDESKLQMIVMQHTLSLQDFSEPFWIYLYRHPALLIPIVLLIILTIILLIQLQNIKFRSEQISRRKKAEYEAEHDVLTGLLNRQAYKRIVEKINKENLPVCYMILDIDYFKDINDTYGHDVGDRVLVKLAGLLEFIISEGDYAFRFGGDEFVILFGNSTPNHMEEIAIKLHNLEEQLANADNDIPAACLSAGLCFCPTGIHESVYRQADKALYHTKKNGRNGYTMMDETGNVLYEFHEELKASIHMPKNQMLDRNLIGSWRMEIPTNGTPCLYCDETMLDLLGLAHTTAPEECYTHWTQNIDAAYMPLVMTAVEKILETGHAEVWYLWHHPKMGTLKIRCGGTYDTEYKDGQCIYGIHQDITNTVILTQPNADA